jgi:hypothetical protein
MLISATLTRMNTVHVTVYYQSWPGNVHHAVPTVYVHEPDTYNMQDRLGLK